jgi:hypothetical protein
LALAAPGWAPVITASSQRASAAGSSHWPRRLRTISRSVAHVGVAGDAACRRLAGQLRGVRVQPRPARGVLRQGRRQHRAAVATSRFAIFVMRPMLAARRCHSLACVKDRGGRAPRPAALRFKLAAMNAPVESANPYGRLPLEGEGPVDPQRQRDVVARLRTMLPEHCVLFREEDTRPYECDGLTLYRQLPLAAVLPESEEQVVAVVQVCRDMGVPIVPRGAGTGLSGGALPHAGGVLLSTAKLNRIVRLDPYARTAVVEPGVRNLAITEAAAPHGLYYAPDPSSQIACTIAGNVAENSGGVHCLKYGLTFHNVLAVRGVTSEGDRVEFGSTAPDVPGLDLLSLVIGSEGMLRWSPR